MQADSETIRCILDQYQNNQKSMSTVIAQRLLKACLDKDSMQFKFHFVQQEQSSLQALREPKVAFLCQEQFEEAFEGLVLGFDAAQFLKKEQKDDFSLYLTETIHKTPIE